MLTVNSYIHWGKICKLRRNGQNGRNNEIEKALDVFQSFPGLVSFAAFEPTSFYQHNLFVRKVSNPGGPDVSWVLRPFDYSAKFYYTSCYGQALPLVCFCINAAGKDSDGIQCKFGLMLLFIFDRQETRG